MKIEQRLCVEDYTVTDSEGTSFTVQGGKYYTTSAAPRDGALVVFSRFWVHVPARIFGLGEAAVLKAMRESGLEPERLCELARQVQGRERPQEPTT